ncbi:hypothetical protein I6E84_05995 [Psychrobacter sp. SCQQ22]|uniref:hypothetical protein n=1 Tax=Psychrobacter sp. SCQQ22 TaxID=2792059 RepID=UPI0018CF1B9C|nr:hypothetical protein [Psychrobacter sp. SCQQ22]MBH0085766.1 hypothetical protein [Psychrobacter sp. SCQQ22]
MSDPKNSGTNSEGRIGPGVESDQGGKIRVSIGDAAIGQSPTTNRPAPPTPDHNPNK